jgi:hypothetical protein
MTAPESVGFDRCRRRVALGSMSWGNLCRGLRGRIVVGRGGGTELLRAMAARGAVPLCCRTVAVQSLETSEQIHRLPYGRG